MRPKPESALLILGHGSTVNPDSAEPTLEHADRIRAAGLFGEVGVAFWKEEPSFRQALHTLDAREIYAVPNFISEGYFTRKVIPRELGIDGPVTLRDGRRINYCEPVGNHPHMTGLLLARAAEVAPGVPPSETSLVIAGHGTALNDNSAVAAKREAARIAGRNLYHEVLCAYMEEEPLLSRWDEFTAAPNVVVVPFFISDGLHSYQDIPVLLGIENETGPAASRRAVFRGNPHPLRGRNLFYANAIGTAPEFAGLIVDQVEAFDEAHPQETRCPA
jgi:sirohydrochlorin cobaltochelatase